MRIYFVKALYTAHDTYCCSIPRMTCVYMAHYYNSISIRVSISISNSISIIIVTEGVNLNRQLR